MTDVEIDPSPTPPPPPLPQKKKRKEKKEKRKERNIESQKSMHFYTCCGLKNEITGKRSCLLHQYHRMLCKPKEFWESFTARIET